MINYGSYHSSLERPPSPRRLRRGSPRWAPPTYYTYIYIYIWCVYIYIYIYMYMIMYMYMYMYMYVYMYTYITYNMLYYRGYTLHYIIS